MESSGGVMAGSSNSRRLPSSKPPAPPPPQRVLKCDPADVEINEEDIPRTLTASHRRGLLKQSRENAKEPQALVFRKLEGGGDQDNKAQTGSQALDEQKPSLAHSGETMLATFYGMLYTNDGSEKEWKLEVDEFLPVCCVQVHGNANKPFRIIAVEGSKRIMEYQVTANTTCARSKTFVKWQDGSTMFGARFANEDRAEQFFSTVSRMASNVTKFAQLMKQPERKDVLRKMSDPSSSSSIHHTKVSLMIKLPDKQTTVMSVPGLLTMNELFDLICEKENLNPVEHQLSLPRMGTRKVTFDSSTALGSLMIREVSILKTVATENSSGSLGDGKEEDSIEDLLDNIEGEGNKILQIHLPSGVKKSFRVPLDMTMRQLVMRVCSRESLNPRQHSLQYIDFKHEFLDMTSTVEETEAGQMRLMDKRGRNIHKITKNSLTDDIASPPSCNSRNLIKDNAIQYRKSTGVELESDSSPTSSRTDRGNNRHSVASMQKTISLEALQEEKKVKPLPRQGGHEVAHEPTMANGTVPSSARRNSSDGAVKKKPPIPPLPGSVKSAQFSRKQTNNLHADDLKEQSVSPIKKQMRIYASSPDLSLSSPESGEWPGSRDIKTSTPESKRTRRAAPPPPARPARPKPPVFPELKPAARGVETKGEEPRLPSNDALSRVTAAAANDQLKRPSQKRRPAPPRPSRPPPPQPAARKDVAQKVPSGGGAEADLEQEKKSRKTDPASLSLDFVRPRSDSEGEDPGDDDWRGIPVFIPPPPPDELPPPLDECETPVGPLTDFEADFLEGTTVEKLPVTVNGIGSQETTGKFPFTSSHGNTQAHSGKPGEAKREAVVEAAEMRPPVQQAPSDLDQQVDEDVFTVVPPPPLYSELPESFFESSLAENELKAGEVISPPYDKEEPKEAKHENKFDFDILTNIVPPPPLLETAVEKVNTESEEKDHDSGFDQSPDYLTLTPPVDPSVGTTEEPDPGSSFDAVSALPPPEDFETRPITPPGDFANPTILPPLEFVTADETESKCEADKPKKKLNVSGSLFPWMNEPQEPLNAVVPPAVTKPEESSVKVEVPELESAVVSRTESPQQMNVPGEANADITDEEFVKRYIESPRKQENQEPKVTHDALSGKTALQATDIPDVITLETELPMKPPTEQNKGASLVQEVEQVVLKETESSKEVDLRPSKPATKTKPMKVVKEAEVTFETQVKTEASVQREDLRDRKPVLNAEPQAKPVSVQEKLELKVGPSVDNVTAESEVGEVSREDVEKKKKKKPRAKPASVQDRLELMVGTSVDNVTAESEDKEPSRGIIDKKPQAKPVLVQDKVELKVGPSVNNVTTDSKPEVIGPSRGIVEEKKEASSVPLVQEREKIKEVFSVPSVQEIESTTDASPVPTVQQKEKNKEVSSVHSVQERRPPETKAKSTRLVKEPEVRADTYIDKQVPFEPNQPDSKPEVQVRPAVKSEVQVEPAVKPEVQVKHAVKSEVQVKPSAKPEIQVKPAAMSDTPEVESSVEKVVRSESKPELEELTRAVAEQHSVQDRDERKSPPIIDVKLGKSKSSLQKASARESSPVEEQKIVLETLVTAQTKPNLSASDPFKDLEAKLHELDEESSVSSSRSRDARSEATVPLRAAESAVKSDKAVLEDIIVAETKQVEFSSYEQLGEQLFRLETEDESTEKVVLKATKEEKLVEDRQSPRVERSTLPTEGTTEFSLDLSSLRRSPEPAAAPRPPSSSPPAVSPGSAGLPSPHHATRGEAQNEESTESGIQGSQKSSPSGEVVLAQSSLAKPADLVDEENASKVVKSLLTTQGEVPLSKQNKKSLVATQGEVPQSNQNIKSLVTTQSEVHKQNIKSSVTTQGEVPLSKQDTAVNTKDVPVKLQRPLSLPADFVRFSKSVDLEKEQKASQSQQSSRGESPDVCSSPLSPSPITVATTDPEELPRPPPLTVPPLRRYSDLAADLNFVTSAAKITEREPEPKKESPVKPPTADLNFVTSAAKIAEREPEPKKELPMKPPAVLPKRHSISAVERPRSWIAPESDSKKKSLGWSSAFRPVSFSGQGTKVVRPVDFTIKPVSSVPSSVPVPSTSTPPPQGTSTTPPQGTSTPSPQGGVQTTEHSAAKNSERKTHSPHLEKTAVSAKPSETKTAGTSVSESTNGEVSPIHRPGSAGSEADRTLGDPRVTHSDSSSIYRPRSAGSEADRTLGNPRVTHSDNSSIHRPRSAGSEADRTQGDPQRTHSDSSEKKYEIIYSDNSSKSQEVSRSHKERSDSKTESLEKGQTSAVRGRSMYSRFSRVDNAPSKEGSNVAAKREGKSDVFVRDRTRSAIVGGTKFKILPSDEESSPQKENKDLKKGGLETKVTSQPINVSKSAVPWKLASDHSKVNLPRTGAKPQEAVKTPSQPLPPVVLRTKTATDPTKRHSLPTYIIEGAGTQKPAKTIGSGEAKLHFVVEQADTDTDVVPQGVVAAMRALREKEKREKKKKGLTEGN